MSENYDAAEQDDVQSSDSSGVAASLREGMHAHICLLAHAAADKWLLTNSCWEVAGHARLQHESA